MRPFVEHLSIHYRITQGRAEMSLVHLEEVESLSN